MFDQLAHVSCDRGLEQLPLENVGETCEGIGDVAARRGRIRLRPALEERLDRIEQAVVGRGLGDEAVGTGMAAGEAPSGGVVSRQEHDG